MLKLYSTHDIQYTLRETSETQNPEFRVSDPSLILSILSNFIVKKKSQKMSTYNDAENINSTLYILCVHAYSFNNFIWTVFQKMFGRFH